MKRSVLFFFCLLSFSLTLGHNQVVQAEVEQYQLEAYIISIDWSVAELDNYLEFYGRSLQQFESLEELKSFLGTPINNENMNDLLARYELHYEDLQTLLAEYGEEIDDYKFLEDLEVHVQFFLNKQEEFTIINDFLSLFGLTEAEMENLFEHFSSLDNESLTKQLSEIDVALQSLEYLRYQDQVTLEEQQQLITLWNEMMSSLHVVVEFSLVQDSVTTDVGLNQLLAMDTLEQYSLQMTLFNEDGDLLATSIYTDDMLQSNLVYESLEQMVEVARLAEDYRETLQFAKLPTTAAHYVTNILISLIMIFGGLLMLKAVRRRVDI